MNRLKYHMPGHADKAKSIEIGNSFTEYIKANGIDLHTLVDIQAANKDYDEFCEIVKELQDDLTFTSVYRNGIVYSLDNKYIDNSKPICYTHNWVEYVGITEIYEYCKICDEKRPLK